MTICEKLSINILKIRRKAGAERSPLQYPVFGDKIIYTKLYDEIV